MKNENENKKERKIIPIFKMDGLVHHSDYMKICGVEHSSSTTNMEYVSCVKCLELIAKKGSDVPGEKNGN